MVGRGPLGVVILALSSAPLAATTYEINLAAQQPGESRMVTISPGKDIQIRVMNRLPRGKYSVNVLEEIVPIPPFQWPLAKPTVGPNKLLPPPTLCETNFSVALDGLRNASQEGELPGLRRSLDLLVDLHPQCTNQIQEAASLAASTWEIVAEGLAAHAGQRITIVVERMEPVSATPLIWRKTWSTPERGNWSTGYGLTSFPQLSRDTFRSPAKHRRRLLSPARLIGANSTSRLRSTSPGSPRSSCFEAWPLESQPVWASISSSR